MEKSKKRLREHSSASSERMAILEDLAHENENVRVKAAARLIERLQNPNNGEDVDQLLSRLFRGLCSPRKAARLGFSIALTEILGLHAQGRAADAVAFLTKSDQVQGKTKAEARNELLGKVFGAEAIVESNILFEGKGESDQDHWKQLLEILFSLAAKKPWIREECCWVASIGLKSLVKNGLGGEWPQIILQLLVTHGLTETPEGVALWIEAIRAFPSITKPRGVYEKDDPLSKKNWKSLLRILKEQDTQSAPDAENKQTNRSSWSARPNFAWNVIFGALPEDQFARFWREIVDEGLFASSSSHERKHWGFSLFGQMVLSSRAERIPDLFSSNLCKCMANHIAGKDRSLYAAAEHALKAILGRAEATPDASGSVVVRVLQPDLSKTFSHGPLRNKLVDKLLASTSLSAAEQVADFIIPLLQKNTKESRTDLDRSCLDLLVSMIRLRPYPTARSVEIDLTRDLYCKILSALASATYCNPSQPLDDSSKETRQGKGSQTLRQYQQDKVWTFLTIMSTREAQPHLYPQTVVQAVTEYGKETGNYPIPGKEAASAIKKAHTAIEDLDYEEFGTPETGVLRLLLIVCLIQTYNGEDDALETADDLLECRGNFAVDAEQDQKAQASEMVVEVLLSFISKPPVFLKTIASEAFLMFAESVTDAALQSMFAVLESKESLSGQREMFDSRGDEEDEQDGDGEDDSDVEMIDGGGNEEEASDSASNTSDESSIDGEANNELAEFDAKLAEALGTRRADDDLAHQEDESSESDMDDEQMEALDGHISLMFKQRKAAEGNNNRKEQKNAKETIVNFKSRVLELLERFISKQHHSPLALRILPVALELIKTTQDRNLAAKAARLVQDFSKLVKLTVPDDNRPSSEPKTIHKADENMKSESSRLLHIVHKAASQHGSNQYQTACSTASILLTKSYLSNGGRLRYVFELYSNTDFEWVTSKKSGTKKLFFDAWNDWKAQARSTLAK